MKTPVYITAGLLEALLDLAGREDPSKRTVPLTVRQGQSLTGTMPATVDPDTPVFTDFYLPAEQQSTSTVFGIDVSTPPRQTQGLFISHPRGELTVTVEDKLHEIMIIAVPPWDPDNVKAFDREGRQRPLTVIDAVPPDPESDGWEPTDSS